jgi:hypothetical protein
MLLRTGLALFFLLQTSQASVLMVSALNDGSDGSLRQTIADAIDGDSIMFGFSGDLVLTDGEIVIDKSLSILGPGPKEIRLNGNGRSRIFKISSGTVQIAGLTFSNGFVHGTQNSDGVGGAIYNAASLSISNCVFSSNVAVGGDLTRSEGSAGSGQGGAVCNVDSGIAVIRNSLFIGNQALGGAGLNPLCNNMCIGGRGEGGALFTSGSMTIVNCTFYRNRSDGSTSGNFAGRGSGGAIFSSISSLIPIRSLFLINCTITENSATGLFSLGGGFTTPSYNPPGSNVFWNTIVARNTSESLGPDVSRQIISRGNNLIGNADSSGGWTPNDFLGTGTAPVDPKLGPLQDNGGSTLTMAPIGGLAFNGGDDAVLLRPWNIETDQRGEPRLYNAHVDIGAVEWAPPNIPFGFGSDNFNDSIRDTNKWGLPDSTSGSGRLTEINSRLEFTATPASNDYDDVRSFFAKTLPRSVDWVATLDAHIAPLAIPPDYSAGWDIVVMQSGIAQNRVTIGFWELGVGQPTGQHVFRSEAFTNGISQSLHYVNTGDSDVTIRIRYLTTNQTLLAEYLPRFATKFVTLSSFNTTLWPFDLSPAFRLQVQAHSSKVIVSSGVMYADNFQVLPSMYAPVISLRQISGAVALDWPTQEGIYYQIQQSSGLPIWENLGVPFLGTGGRTTNSFSTGSNHLLLKIKVSSDP